MCIYMFVDKKKLNRRLTFSNIRGKTSRKTYRQALPLLSQEKFSSLSKKGISYLMHNVLYFCEE